MIRKRHQPRPSPESRVIMPLHVTIIAAILPWLTEVRELSIMTIFIGIKTIQMIQPRNGSWNEWFIGIPLPQRQTKKFPKSNKRNPAKFMKKTKMALMLVGLLAAALTTKASIVVSDDFNSYT